VPGCDDGCGGEDGGRALRIGTRRDPLGGVRELGLRGRHVAALERGQRADAERGQDDWRVVDRPSVLERLGEKRFSRLEPPR